ncbi:zf-HC2 domain-containing protein [Archangium sp.]|uniref:anti-sigma factor family protein n=1 Tax=Archangium sp. TaxID=1872627 RepID=UPI00286CF069|nr:zf-HC2 domain-containing protein [Archangium sp.]
MKPQGSHANEDRLLDFAYGELPPSEARVMEQHVLGCSRCSEALDGIRGVRTTMSRLPLHSAPEAGLESLLAYAQQAARRSAAGPEPAPRWWRRLLAPALSMAALGVFGIVVVQVNRSVDLSPTLTTKKEAPAEMAMRPEPAKNAPLPMTQAVPAAAAPSAPSPETQVLHQQMDKRMQAEMRTPPSKKAPKVMRRGEYSDWSNAGAGSAGGFPDKKEEAAKSKDGLASSGRTRNTLATAQPEAAPAGNVAPADAEESRVAEAASAPMPSAPQQVAQYTPPSSPAPRAKSSASRTSSKGSMADADDVALAPGRDQLPMPAEPPPPPAAQAQGVEREAKADVVARKSEAKPATASSAPSPTELLRQADIANRSGDRAQESALLRGALSAGVRGSQRVETLSRLCEAELALGRRQNALEFCKRVMSEAPGSSEARVAQRLLERELASEADAARQ